MKNPNYYPEVYRERPAALSFPWFRAVGFESKHLAYYWYVATRTVGMWPRLDGDNLYIHYFPLVQVSGTRAAANIRAAMDTLYDWTSTRGDIEGLSYLVTWPQALILERLVTDGEVIRMYHHPASCDAIVKRGLAVCYKDDNHIKYALGKTSLTEPVYNMVMARKKLAAHRDLMLAYNPNELRRVYKGDGWGPVDVANEPEPIVIHHVELKGRRKFSIRNEV
jgi:hypothetical protein